VELQLGGFRVDWLSTPGHTDGSVCFIIEDQLFAGDTILRAGFGRADLPGGSPEKLAESVERLRALDPDLVVQPGHGEPFRLGDGLDHLLQKRSDAA
jgi:glyoxylase-like metal-dependent hydrolase (beta-lactamase superfamily II)